eukprot:COSAG06_NODE_22155_length_732_cov_1.151659_1_plen_85_part_01
MAQNGRVLAIFLNFCFLSRACLGKKIFLVGYTMAQKGRFLAPALPSALICGAQLYHGGTYFGSTGCPEPPLKDTVRQNGAFLSAV